MNGLVAFAIFQQVTNLLQHREEFSSIQDVQYEKSDSQRRQHKTEKIIHVILLVDPDLSGSFGQMGLKGNHCKHIARRKHRRGRKKKSDEAGMRNGSMGC